MKDENDPTVGAQRAIRGAVELVALGPSLDPKDERPHPLVHQGVPVSANKDGGMSEIVRE